MARDLEAALEAAAASLDTVDELSPRDAFRKRNMSGGQLVQALARDPLLPPELLPAKWPASRLRRSFLELDRILLEKSLPFIEQALSK